MRPTVLARTAASLAIALLLAGTLLAAIPASTAASTPSGDPTGTTLAAGPTAAMKCNPPSCWLGGAFNVETGHAFTWTNASARTTARRLAVRTCRQESADGRADGCRPAGTNRHGCLAIAYRASDGELLQWAHRSADFTRRLTRKETRRKSVRRVMRAVEGEGEEYFAIGRCTGR